MIAPESRAEKDAFELWTQLRPDDAYVSGVTEAVGKFFIPTAANVRHMRARIAKIRASTKDETIRKFLASFDKQVAHTEPPHLPEIMEAFFTGYIIKRAVEPALTVTLSWPSAEARA